MGNTVMIPLVVVLALTIVLNLHKRGVSPGMYRAYFMLAGIAALSAFFIPNLWLQSIVLLLIFNFIRDPNMGVHLPRFMPFALFVAGGVMVFPHLGKESVFPLLAAMSMAGAVLSCYCIVNIFRELDNRAHIKLYAGQENVNNTQSISVVCTCATIGLAVAFDIGWWGVVPLVSFPILWTTWNDWHCEGSVTMGPVILLGVGLMALPLVIGWWAVALIPFVLIGLAVAVIQAFRHEKWWDSGRIRCWYTSLLTGWWEGGWKVRLLGRGWQSWIGFQDFLVDVARKTNRHYLVNTKFMMSTPHNEFVHILFEHGAIGLVLLSGYILTALWQLAHGGPEAMAVYFAAVGMVGVACTLHPWTWTHGSLSECDEHGEPVKEGGGYKLFTIGSPALNWLALIVALLVEVAR